MRIAVASEGRASVERGIARAVLRSSDGNMYCQGCSHGHRAGAAITDESAALIVWLGSPAAALAVYTAIKGNPRAATTRGAAKVACDALVEVLRSKSRETARVTG